MRLTKIRIRNFRSITDSGEITIEPLQTEGWRGISPYLQGLPDRAFTLFQCSNDRAIANSNEIIHGIPYPRRSKCKNKRFQRSAGHGPDMDAFCAARSNQPYNTFGFCAWIYDCLSKLILFGETSLRRALREYLIHYHAEIIKVKAISCSFQPPRKQRIVFKG